MKQALQKLAKFFDLEEKWFSDRLKNTEIIAWADELGPKYTLSNFQHNLLINNVR